MREQLLTIALEQDEQPKQYFKRVFLMMLKRIESNSLIRDLYVDMPLKQLFHGLPNKRVSNHRIKDEEAILQIINPWESLGIRLNISPKVVASIFRALFILTLHRSLIGEDEYEETIETIVQGLTNEIIN